MKVRVLAGTVLAVLLPVAGSAMEVAITEPLPGEPVFGEVTLAVDAWPGAEVAEVVLRVDGVEVGRLSRPPYRLRVDLGKEYREHRIEAVARDRDGRTARDLRVTPAVRVDEVLDLRLQELFLTVTRDGRRVRGLDRTDFRVLDDGQEQEVVAFARGGVPLTAVLLVDASESMRGERLPEALAGVEAFVGGMRPLDRTKLLLFSDHLVHTTPFTSFAEVVTAGASGAQAAGGTALNDHLYLALKLLESQQGQQVVILLSDGVDTASALSLRDLLPVIRRRQALLYWLRLGASGRGVVSSAWRTGREHASELDLLMRSVEESGGRVVGLSGAGEIRPAFMRILEELRDQYVLGFHPRRRRGEGSWHRVEVEVPGRRVAVRCRQGYLE